MGCWGEGLTLLSKVSLPLVTLDQLASLDKITEAEVVAAIKHLALVKAPGPNGYSGEFYKGLSNLRPHKTL